MNRRGLFPALAASLLLAVTAVVAQDLTDFDPKAIEARADKFKADAQALFDYATANAQTQAEEAQTVVAQGYEAVEGTLRNNLSPQMSAALSFSTSLSRQGIQ